MIAQRSRGSFHIAIGVLEREHRFATDAFHLATREATVGIPLDGLPARVDQLELERRGSDVENKDVHGAEVTASASASALGSRLSALGSRLVGKCLTT